MENEVSGTSVSAGGNKKIKLILIITASVIVVLVGSFFAYGKFIKKADTVTEMFSLTKLNSNCKYNDPDLCKFMNNWKDIKSLTMTSISTDKDNKKYEYIFKTENDTNDQMISFENGKENYNRIVLGDTSYTKDYSDNKWFKYTYKKDQDSELNTEESKLDFDDKAESVEDKTTYKQIGKEACGKLTCFKYQIIDPTMIESTEYIYFDNKEYTLRKTRSEGNDGSVTESTFDYSKVTISEPSPTKDGNPYDFSSSIPTSSSTEELQAQVDAMNAASSSVDTSATTADTSSDSSTSESVPTEDSPIE